METKRGVSCIIPFYNERNYIGAVLEVVTRIDGLDEVICVDDGSTDDSPAFVATQYPSVKLLRQPENKGKAEAIRLALNHVEHGVVLLIDADLRQLSGEEIRHAIHIMVRNNNTDMVILSRRHSPWYLRLFRINTLLSGERLLRTSDLKRILDNEVDGYELETAINLYMWSEKRRVCHLMSSARNTFKSKKLKSLAFLAKETKMYFDIIRHAGLQDLLCLTLFFARNKVRTKQSRAMLVAETQ